MSVETIFHNSSNNLSQSSKKELADTIKQKFVSADGDHITLLNVFKAFVSNKNNKEWCNENFLDYKNLKLAVEICKQLREICKRNNIHVMSSLTDTVNIRLALIYGFFMNAAEYQKENEYKTVGDI